MKGIGDTLQASESRILPEGVMAVMEAPLFSTAELIGKARHELESYRRGEAGTGRYGMMLMRRAFEKGEPRAWEGVVLLFKPQLVYWARSHGGFPQLAACEEDLAMRALERARHALPAKRFAEMERLEQVLACLKLAVHCVIYDDLRRSQRQARRRVDPADDGRPDEDWLDFVDRSGLADDSLEAGLDAEAFWAFIAAQLRSDEERIVIEQTFVFGLAPREIADQSGGRFASAGDVSQIKEKVLRRLRRQPGVQTLRATQTGSH